MNFTIGQNKAEPDVYEVYVDRTFIGKVWPSGFQHDLWFWSLANSSEHHSTTGGKTSAIEAVASRGKPKIYYLYVQDNENNPALEDSDIEPDAHVIGTFDSLYHVYTYLEQTGWQFSIFSSNEANRYDLVRKDGKKFHLNAWVELREHNAAQGSYWW